MKRMWGEVAPPGGGSLVRSREGACAYLPWAGAGAGASAFGESRAFAALRDCWEIAALLGWPRTGEKVASGGRFDHLRAQSPDFPSSF